MPNIYFWQPDSQGHAILQAVLRWEDCDRMLDRATAIRLGDELPSGLANGSGHGAVVVLYVSPAEANIQWTAVFYRLRAGVAEIHESVEALKQSPPSSLFR